MKSQYIIFVICLVIIFPIYFFATDFSYSIKYYDLKFKFNPKFDEICIKFKSDTKILDIKRFIKKYNLKLKTSGITKLKFGVFESLIDESFSDIKIKILNSSKVKNIIPVFIDQEGYKRYVDPEWFTVQFFKHINNKKIRNILKNYQSEIIMDFWTKGYFIVQVPQGMSIFEAVRIFNELTYPFGEVHIDFLNEACR
ncbi:hypothetical protein ACX8XN_05500 [Calditrichota bacterium GD2]